MMFQKYTVILDLDETLVHTVENKDFDENLGKDSDIFRRVYSICHDDNDRYWGLRRKGLDDFLRFLASNFGTVIIWSAAEDQYVRDVVKRIYSGIRRAPDFVFTSDSCHKTNSSTTKPISKLFRDNPCLQHLDPRWVIAIDDKSDNFASTPEQSVIIKPFFFDGERGNDDDELSKVIAWMIDCYNHKFELVGNTHKDIVFSRKVVQNKVVRQVSCFGASCLSKTRV